MKENQHQTTQIVGSAVAEANQQRLAELQASLNSQDRALADALKQIAGVREFIGMPDRILGSSATKHGEIAEQVEVGIRNARDLVDRQPPTATFEGVGRTAPADYSIDGVEVQSKFINGATKGLNHVLDHMRKYDDFGRDGSYYHLPRDQYEVFQKVSNGESVPGLHSRTARSIQQKIQEIEQTSGKPFGAVVKPGVSSYAEVQQGEVQKTLDSHEEDIRDRNTERRAAIELEHQPSFDEMAQVALKGAAFGAVLKTGFKFVEKVTQENKNPFEGQFTTSDWRELGIAAVEGGATGGISGATIYGLTNFAGLSAPLAGAILSAGYSVASLVRRYRQGEIDMNEFFELGRLACAESAMVAIGAAAGQALIPIPVLGTVIGTIASRMVMHFSKQYLGDRVPDLQRELDDYYDRVTADIDRTYAKVVASIMVEFRKLGDLTDAAFDRSKNEALRLQASIDLARAYEVPEAAIIHTTEELDDFMKA
ncbi:MAG: hypothetical protein ACFB9N_12410 [Geitlerinemataceae cyanobacterium]